MHVYIALMVMPTKMSIPTQSQTEIENIVDNIAGKIPAFSITKKNRLFQVVQSTSPTIAHVQFSVYTKYPLTLPTHVHFSTSPLFYRSPTTSFKGMTDASQFQKRNPSSKR